MKKNKKVKIGFLPLYVKLYDDFCSDIRPDVEKYCEDVASALKKEGAELVSANICRIHTEIETALKTFESENVCSIVTLHLAYSPSLESAEVLSKTKLPLILLDTTRDFCFDFNAECGSFMYNHGIHGVQDLTNLLKRLGKDYTVFAGHYLESDVIKRTVNAARAISAAKTVYGTKVGRIGSAFDGMGDFVVSEDVAKRLGITEIYLNGTELEALKDTVSDSDIKAEYELDCKENGCEIPFSEYTACEKTALAVRKWIKKEGLSAFTMNFLDAGKIHGFDNVPFTEACKEMARGVGYAGEGDLIDAAFIGALMQSFDEVNFVEMFCPDWKNGAIYFNHMGESNLALMEDVHMMKKPFGFSDIGPQLYILGNMKAGKGCLLNIAPNACDWYDAIIVEGEMLKVPEGLDNFRENINGWFKPTSELCELLEKYSEIGGTHHSIFIYGIDSKSLSLFAKTLNIKSTVF